MEAILEVESTLTDRYQTTIPVSVRRALKLGKRDKIHYAIRSDGEVVLTRTASTGNEDPILEQFLSFLASDMAHHPQRVQMVDAALVQRIQSLIDSVDVQFDVPLSAADE